MEFGIEPGQSHLENYGCSFQAVVGSQTDYKAGISRRSYVQQGREGEEGGKARMLRVLISAGARPLLLATPTPAVAACTLREVNALSGL